MEEFDKINEMDDKEIGNYDIINIDGIKYRTLIPKKYLDRKPYKPININEIYAFIPGTILKVYVKKKDKVKKGDKLLVFQAMKMSNELVAPIAGVIEDVFVKEGDTVNKTQILIKIK
jgi:biotin carboxyl carrier protein